MTDGVTIQQAPYSVHKFRQQTQGRVLDHNGTLGFNYDECVDVAMDWRMAIGLPSIYGNANSIDMSADCDKILNMPDNFPKPGDMVVYLGYPATVKYGHIAVALFGCDQFKLRLLSQNWPDGSNTHVVVTPSAAYPFVSYEGVGYWWHPRKLGPNGAHS